MGLVPSGLSDKHTLADNAAQCLERFSPHRAGDLVRKHSGCNRCHSWQAYSRDKNLQLIPTTLAILVWKDAHFDTFSRPARAAGPQEVAQPPKAEGKISK